MARTTTSRTTSGETCEAILMSGEGKTTFLSQSAFDAMTKWTQLNQTCDRFDGHVKGHIRSMEMRKQLLHFLDNDKQLRESLSVGSEDWHIARQEQLHLLMTLYTGDFSALLSCCGRLTLADQLLKKEEDRARTPVNKRRSAISRRSSGSIFSKEVCLASELIHHELSRSFTLHSPLSIPPLTFIEELLAQAEGVTRARHMPKALAASAMQLKGTFEALSVSLAQKLEGALLKEQEGRRILAIWSDLAQDDGLETLYHKFEQHWLQFASLYLKNRLFQQMHVAAEDIEMRLVASADCYAVC